MATTTLQLVRDDRRTLIEALSPTTDSAVKFREYKRSVDFRDWAIANETACIRRFSLRVTGDYTPPLVSDMVTEEVIQEFSLVIAYQRNSRYGRDKTNDLYDVIREDHVLIRDTIGVLGLAGYAPGIQLFAQSNAYIIEEEDSVLFSVSTWDVNFHRAVS